MGYSPATGRGSCTPSAYTPQGDCSDRGRGGGRGMGISGPMVYGLANAYVYVEQEKDNIWKVSSDDTLLLAVVQTHGRMFLCVGVMSIVPCV